MPTPVVIMLVPARNFKCRIGRIAIIDLVHEAETKIALFLNTGALGWRPGDDVEYL